MSEGASRIPRAIVAGHGDFASGLISALDQITGRGGDLVGISNAGLTLDFLQFQIAAQIERGVEVVFTDLPAGSATMAARKAAAGGKAVVVTGVNLPTLLDFIFSSEESMQTASVEAAKRGRETIVAHESR